MKRIIFLGLLGAFFSLYLVYHHISLLSGLQTGASFCSLGGKFDCDLVAKSEYAQLFGIPVASFSLAFYLILTGFAYFARRDAADSFSRQISLVCALSFFSLFPSAFLLWVSAVKIGSFCLFCLLLDLVNLVLFVTSLWLKDEAVTETGRGIHFRRIVQGLALLLRLPAQLWERGVNGSSRRYLQLGLSATVATFLASIFFPSFLEKNVIAPARDAALQSTLSRGLFHEWQNARVFEIPVIVSGPVEQQDFVLGDVNAKHTMVVFSDFECPFCRRAAAIFEKLAQSRPDVRLVFKNFPLDRNCNSLLKVSKHRFACLAAVYARCAAVEGVERFWKMHDALFELQATSLNPNSIESVPRTLGFFSETLSNCLNTRAMLPKIVEDVKLATTLEVRGTPSVFINGKRLETVNEGALRLVLESLQK